MRVLLACPRYIVAGNLTYLKCLIRQLSSVRSVDLYILVNKKQIRYFTPLIEGKKIYTFSGPSYLEGIAVKKIELKHSFDIIHFTNTLLPLGFKSRAKTICTIHDLNFLTFSQGILKDWYKKIIYKNAKNSNGLIFISEYTQKVYLEFVKKFSRKRKVIYEASGFSFNMARSSALKKQGLNLLCFGHRAHKNAEAAIKILALLNERFTLTIIGCHSKKTLSKLVSDLGLETRVSIHKYVSDEQLINFYGTSFAFIFLSKYEGFGLPLLEAMSAGCPVITHDICSLPEVAGNAAYYIENNRSGYQKAAKFILRLYSDKGLYQEYKEKSEVQFRKFSWARNGLETRKFYEEVLNQN